MLVAATALLFDGGIHSEHVCRMITFPVELNLEYII
jgi:hypothetical protein